LRALKTLVVHELRYQARSVRFWIGVVAYVVIGSVPAIAIFMGPPRRWVIGGGTFAAETLLLLPLLVTFLAALLSVNAVNREREEGSWSVIALAPLSNSTFVIGRLTALNLIVLPFTVLPLLVGFVLSSMGGADPQLGHFLGPWCLHLVPLVLVVSALALSCGVLAGGEIGGLLLACGLSAGWVTSINYVLGFLRLRLGGLVSPWLGFDPGANGWRMFRERVRLGFFPFPASEAPYDPALMAPRLLSEALPFLALALLALGAAVAHLRRTQPDVPPSAVSEEHQLATLLNLFRSLFWWLRPDPYLRRGDRVCALGFALLGGLVMTGAIWSARTAWKRAETKAQVEASGDPSPTSPGMRVLTFQVEGSLEHGRVETEVLLEVENAGDSAAGRLAFELAEPLSAQPSGSGTRVRIADRRWTRLVLAIDPPLQPGEAETIELSIAGEALDWPLGHRRGFSAFFGSQAGAKSRNDLLDWSTGYRLPIVSRSGFLLPPSFLMPVPRYTPWELASDGIMPRETVRPRLPLSIDLTSSGEILLADSCGSISRIEGAVNRLVGSCEMPIADYSVAGGAYQEVELTDHLTMATYPQHRDRALAHSKVFAEAAALAEEHWPEMGAFFDGVAVEVPWYRVWDRSSENSRWASWFYEDARSLDGVEVRGHMLLVPESDLIQREPLEPVTLATRSLAAGLLARRPLAPGFDDLGEALVREIAKRQLGLGPPTGAVVPAFTGGPHHMLVAAWDAEFHAVEFWELRFPALVAELESRVGRQALRRSLEEILDPSRPGPWSPVDLFADLEESTGVSLEQYLLDYYEGASLPELAFANVVFRQTPSGTWLVTGQLTNKGSGYATCPVVVVTATGSAMTTVNVGSGEEAAFRISSNHTPQYVALDPDNSCHRYRTPIVPERINFEGGS
jgi:hypothetical protein